jgi:hypothetical protein
MIPSFFEGNAEERRVIRARRSERLENAEHRDIVFKDEETMFDILKEQERR